MLKSFLLALPLLAFVAPVAAQDIAFVSGTGDRIEAGPAYVDEDSEAVDDVADRFSDAEMQSDIAATIERASAAMLDLPIGRFAEAIERARPGTIDGRVDYDDTVGDLAGSDAEDLPERLGQQSREIMGMMGGFAQAMAAMLPEFERMGRKVEESVDTARREARRR